MKIRWRMRRVMHYQAFLTRLESQTRKNRGNEKRGKGRSKLLNSLE